MIIRKLQSENSSENKNHDILKYVSDITRATKKIMEAEELLKTTNFNKYPELYDIYSEVNEIKEKMIELLNKNPDIIRKK